MKAITVIGLLLSLKGVFSQTVTVMVPSALSVQESAGSVEVCISAQSGSIFAGRSFVVGYLTSPSSASAGSDYTTTTGSVTISQSNQQECVAIPILSDSVSEGNEVFNFLIFNQNNNPDLLESPTQTVITILDSSAPTPVTIGFQFTSYQVIEGNSQLVCVQVQNNQQLDREVMFTYATSGGSAVSSVDFTPISTTLSFGPANDQQLMCMNIQTTQDSITELTEVFSVGLSTSEAGVTFSPQSATVSIPANDDPCDSSPCDPNASCTPTIGGVNQFTCACNTGFVGDGFACMAMTGGADPHFSIVLPSGKLLCFTVQGEHGFAFNLISTDRVHINALFVPDSVREEVTWMGALGIIVKGEEYHGDNKTSLRFDAKTKTVSVGSKLTLSANGVESLRFRNGKLIISEKEPGDESFDYEHPSVCVNLEDVGLHFHVTFFGEHLDIFWNSVTIDNEGNKNIHGLIGQFYREGVKIDTVRKLLLLPKMEPVPVMRRPVWGFMEREVKDDQLCWTAMNAGYQGVGLIQGTYFDYLVNDVLDNGFVFGKKV